MYTIETTTGIRQHFESMAEATHAIDLWRADGLDAVLISGDVDYELVMPPILTARHDLDRVLANYNRRHQRNHRIAAALALVILVAYMTVLSC